VPFLAALTDRVDAKLVYLAGALFAAVSVMGFALAADGFWTAFAWRLLARRVGGNLHAGAEGAHGSHFRRRQPRWISYYTASFSLGTSGSFLMTGAMAAPLDGRAAFGLAAATAAAAFLLSPSSCRRSDRFA